jgi:hypothetical protein
MPQILVVVKDSQSINRRLSPKIMVPTRTPTKFCSGTSRQRPRDRRQSPVMNNQIRSRTMSPKRFVTRRPRGAIWLVAAASMLLTSASDAGVNRPACPSATTIDQQAHRRPHPGPGLLAVVRHLAGAQPNLFMAQHDPNRPDGEPEGLKRRLTDTAMRERIARYQLSPATERRYAALSPNSRGRCSN